MVQLELYEQRMVQLELYIQKMVHLKLFVQRGGPIGTEGAEGGASENVNAENDLLQSKYKFVSFL
jgi:hypothetical protein